MSAASFVDLRRNFAQNSMVYPLALAGLPNAETKVSNLVETASTLSIFFYFGTRGVLTISGVYEVSV